MQYDPIKHSLGKVFNRHPVLRRLFYQLLDLLLLRAWHIRSELRKRRRSAPEVKNILDAGSGFGQYSFRMAQWFPNARVKAVDIKPEQIEDCNRFMQQAGLSERVKFELADLTRFQEKETYDLVLSVDVMEHIEEDVQVFRNFYASMKKGGLLLISTPSDQGGSDTHDHDHGEAAHGFIDEHVRDGYNIAEIETKLKSAGFSKVEARYSYGTPGKISWRLSMKYPILMLGASKLFFIVLPFYYLVFYPIALVLNFFDLKMNHKSGTGLIVKAWK
jgi:2-polyprenyl-3-methyl-5-hydroxy-6-metoxy-1,4-benzoquinol methylase